MQIYVPTYTHVDIHKYICMYIVGNYGYTHSYSHEEIIPEIMGTISPSMYHIPLCHFQTSTLCESLVTI